jgi:hypothetical protein
LIDVTAQSDDDDDDDDDDDRALSAPTRLRFAWMRTITKVRSLRRRSASTRQRARKRRAGGVPSAWAIRRPSQAGTDATQALRDGAPPAASSRACARPADRSCDANCDGRKATTTTMTMTTMTTVR